MKLDKPQVFEDGSSIEWIDRETLRYGEGNFAVLIWVDVEPGLFNTGRIIRKSSLHEWTETPPAATQTIDVVTRSRIVARAEQYFQARGIRVTVLD